jgi:hypothetical protein
MLTSPTETDVTDVKIESLFICYKEGLRPSSLSQSHTYKKKLVTTTFLLERYSSI